MTEINCTLDQNALPFIPRRQWYQPVLELQKELNALRRELFEHPQFKAMVASERDRLRREGEKTEFGIEASLMSRIVQTCENEVLGIVDRVFFDLGWDTLALVFGLRWADRGTCRGLPAVGAHRRAGQGKGGMQGEGLGHRAGGQAASWAAGRHTALSDRGTHGDARLSGVSDAARLSAAVCAKQARWEPSGPMRRYDCPGRHAAEHTFQGRTRER